MDVAYCFSGAMKKTRLSVTLSAAVLLTVGGGILGWCTTPPATRVAPDQSSLAHREERLHHVPVHASEFSPLAEPLALPRCGASRPPEALATPDPLLKVENAKMRVRVSLIVGADGHVYSPFIMDSGGPSEDRVVLHAVQRWRYRPAMCNGVPTDSEARVLFSNR
jgi:TonB family protein